MISNSELTSILNVCIEFTNEKDKNLLMSKLLDVAMEFTDCDAGTIYLKRNDALEFTVMKAKSIGIDKGAHGERIELPPVPLEESNVCAYSAIHHKLINIRDVYTERRFDFAGPKRYDAMTGYHTGSMLVIPIENDDGRLVGVMQLLNGGISDKTNCFLEDDEFVLKALASMTTVLLLNMANTADIKKMMHSFVSAFAAAVDKRTPYNGLHTRKVALYSKLIANELNAACTAKDEDYFDEHRLEQLVLAAYLHDIGKMIIPLGVMNKETRLNGRLADIRRRFDYISVSLERDMLKGSIAKTEYESKLSELDEYYSFIERADTAEFLTDEDAAQVETVARMSYTEPGGKVLQYLTDEECEELKIRRGTLTDEERRIMESHVTMTKDILSEVYFNEDYADVPVVAASHHELLDGSGYPDHIKGKELGLETRILTAADIFDALTAADRPYKKSMGRQQAFAVLESMADAGKLDSRVVSLLEKAVSRYTEDELEAMLTELNLNADE